MPIGDIVGQEKKKNYYTETQTCHEYNSTSNSSANAVREWYLVLRGLVGVIILAGNGVVIYLIVRCHVLHTNSNWFILSLSIADFLVGLILIPIYTSCALWISCNKPVLNMSFDLLLYVSLVNMCAMTGDRYLFIVKPLTYFQTMTETRVFVLVAAAWLIPLLFSLIPLAWIFSESLENKERALSIYGTFQIIGFNIVPCAMMLIIYGHILLISRKHSRQMLAMTVEQRTGNPKTLNLQQRNHESPATRVFGLVVIFFMFCWILSGYRHLCRYFKLRCCISPGTVIASRLLVLLNSAINPLIYAFLKKDIKREITKRMCKERRCNNDIILPLVKIKRNATDNIVT
ncbi:octopamine receptor beta-2R-like [Montipora capricornis]|uniref:octopamine receptor beta-2R-like n=1 Tax=Montipora capricornis TaxID=246305 RepID=UPI0035F1FD95